MPEQQINLYLYDGKVITMNDGRPSLAPSNVPRPVQFAPMTSGGKSRGFDDMTFLQLLSELHDLEGQFHWRLHGGYRPTNCARLGANGNSAAKTDAGGFPDSPPGGVFVRLFRVHLVGIPLGIGCIGVRPMWASPSRWCWWRCIYRLYLGGPGAGHAAEWRRT